MIQLATTTFSPAGVVAALLMILAGIHNRRLRWRRAECPVCHHSRAECTCRWL
jgi:hypothetical protein